MRSSYSTMASAKFVISLDFELFWGVADTQTIAGYGPNVLGEWQAVPLLSEAHSAKDIICKRRL